MRVLRAARHGVAVGDIGCTHAALAVDRVCAENAVNLACVVAGFQIRMAAVALRRAHTAADTGSNICTVDIAEVDAVFKLHAVLAVADETADSALREGILVFAVLDDRADIDAADKANRVVDPFIADVIALAADADHTADRCTRLCGDQHIGRAVFDRGIADGSACKTADQRRALGAEDLTRNRQISDRCLGEAAEQPVICIDVALLRDGKPADRVTLAVKVTCKGRDRGLADRRPGDAAEVDVRLKRVIGGRIGAADGVAQRLGQECKLCRIRNAVGLILRTLAGKRLCNAAVPAVAGDKREGQRVGLGHENRAALRLIAVRRDFIIIRPSGQTVCTVRVGHFALVAVRAGQRDRGVCIARVDREDQRITFALVQRERDCRIRGHGQRAGLRHIAEVGNRVIIVALRERVGRARSRGEQLALGTFAVKRKRCRDGGKREFDGVGLRCKDNLNRAVLLADLHGLHRCGVLGVALSGRDCERIAARFQYDRIAARIACCQRNFLAFGIGQGNRCIHRVDRDREGHRTCGCSKPCGIGVAVLDFKAVDRKRRKIRRGNPSRLAGDLGVRAEALKRRPAGCALILFVVVIAARDRDRRVCISAAVGKAVGIAARHLAAEIAVCKVDGVSGIRAVDDADKPARIADIIAGVRFHITEYRAVFKCEINVHHIAEHAAKIVVGRLCAARVDNIRLGEAVLHRERRVYGIADEAARIGRLRRFNRDTAADDADILNRYAVLADNTAEYRGADVLSLRQGDRRILEDNVMRLTRESREQRRALRGIVFGKFCRNGEILHRVTVAVKLADKGGDRLHRDVGHINVLRQLDLAGELFAAEGSKLRRTADAHGIVGKCRDRTEHRQDEKKPDAFEKSVFHGIYPFFFYPLYKKPRRPEDHRGSFPAPCRMPHQKKPLKIQIFQARRNTAPAFFQKKRCGAASEQVFRLVPYHLRGATRSCLLSFPMTDFRQRSARIRGIRRLVSLGTLTRFPFHRPYPHGTADTLLHIQMSETV